MRGHRTPCTFRHQTQYYRVCVGNVGICVHVLLAFACTGCVRTTRGNALGGTDEPPGHTQIQASAPPYVHMA